MLVVLQSVKAKVVPWAIDALGTGLIVTVCAVEESELQPAAFVVITVNIPDRDVVNVVPIAPLIKLPDSYHWLLRLSELVKVTEVPAQTAPAADELIVGAAGVAGCSLITYVPVLLLEQPEAPSRTYT
jgi:hypothetical protein